MANLIFFLYNINDSQKPITVAHLVFNLTSKFYRKISADSFFAISYYPRTIHAMFAFKFPIYTKITNLVEDLPMNISAKFGPNLFSSFREEDKNMKSLQTWTMTMTDAKWWQKLTWPLSRWAKNANKISTYNKWELNFNS